MLEFKPEDFTVNHNIDILVQDAAEIANDKAAYFNEAFKLLLNQHKYNVKTMDCEDDKRVLAKVMELIGD